MPRILAKADNIDELNRNFAQRQLTAPVFMNSVPKCGTHLMRNILRMFVPARAAVPRAFIQHPILKQHAAAFSRRWRRDSAWGHLFFSDDAAIALQPCASPAAGARPLRLGAGARALLPVRQLPGLSSSTSRGVMSRWRRC
jgi:hypothetical protein